MKNTEVPIWEKQNLTIEEAAAYSNIGICTLRRLLKDPNCPFLLFVGNKKLIKKQVFDKYITQQKIL